MAEEIVRKLVNGEWVTTVENQAGGGGVPDPSGEPDGDVLTVASGVAVWAPGGGSQPAFQANDRAPLNPQVAVWSVGITNGPDSGAFTLLVSVNGGEAVETASLAWDASAGDVTTALQVASGITVNSDGGPLPDTPVVATFGDVAAIGITAGANTLNNSGDLALEQTQVGGLGDLGFPEGAGWWDDDDQGGYVNNGDEVTPEWVQLGNVIDQVSTQLAIPGPVTGWVFTTPLLTDGGGGVASDEFNVRAQDGSGGAAVISWPLDPTETPPSGGNYVTGTLLLRNIDGTTGEAWLRTTFDADPAVGWTKITTA